MSALFFRPIFICCFSSNCMAGFRAVPSFSIATPYAFRIVVSINGFTSCVSDSWRNESSQGLTTPDLVVYPEERLFLVVLDSPPRFGLAHCGLSSPPLPHPCYIGTLTKLFSFAPEKFDGVTKLYDFLVKFVIWINRNICHLSRYLYRKTK